MRTDRELLELAAKAAGVDGVFEHGFIRVPAPGFGNAGFTCWNPLEDDGDALRLAVHLTIELHLDLSVGSIITAFMIGDFGHNTFEEVEENEDCPYAATRRAIVRAAAEIGAAM